MKPVFEKINYKSNSSINGFEMSVPIFSSPLHLHPEIELVYIIKSYGKRYVGNSIQDFKDGDLVLIGSGVPHFWRNHKYFYENPTENACKAMVIQFLPDIFPENLLSKLEFNNIKSILERANCGIYIESKENDSIIELMKMIIATKGIKKLIYLYEVLDFIGKSKNFIYLNESENYEKLLKLNRIRFAKLNNFIKNHFTDNISLKDAAAVANMNPSAFCRYFKKETGQTFIEFLTELRVSSAKNLLRDNTFSISQICFEVGFNNLSNFNRQFKKLVGKSPSQYAAQLINSLN
jgi:AraC-like DNA-binding protein